jgi:hypothetical protein
MPNAPCTSLAAPLNFFDSLSSLSQPSPPSFSATLPPLLVVRAVHESCCSRLSALKMNQPSVVGTPHRARTSADTRWSSSVSGRRERLGEESGRRRGRAEAEGAGRKRGWTRGLAESEGSSLYHSDQTARRASIRTSGLSSPTCRPLTAVKKRAERPPHSARGVARVPSGNVPFEPTTTSAARERGARRSRDWRFRAGMEGSGLSVCLKRESRTKRYGTRSGGMKWTKVEGVA